MKKNSFFIVLILGLIIVYAKRYSYLDTNIVLRPDSEIIFGVEDKVLEQTWSPDVKMLAGITIPYYSEDTFICDVMLKIYNDDYSDVLVESKIEQYNFSEASNDEIDLSFKKIKVIPGERYRIQISLLNASNHGTLRIKSGTNYGGCVVAGKEINAGAALGVTFVKYSKFFWLVAVLFPICSYALFFMIYCNRKFEETVTIAMILEGIICYTFSLFEHLILGINVVYGLGIIALLVSIFLFNKKGKRIKELISPGLIIYFIFIVIIIFTSYGDWLGKRDDLKHWGSAVRDMFYYNTHAKHLDSTVIIKRYFPFATMMEFIFVYMNGMYSEDILFIAMQIMILSVLIIMTKSLQEKLNITSLLRVFVTMVCVPVIFCTDISSTIMVDSLQMALMAYSLICFYTEESSAFNNIRILGGLVVLTITKDIGLVFAGVMAFIMFGDKGIRQIRNRKLQIKELLYPIVCVGVVFMAYMSWQIYLTVPAKPIHTLSQNMEVKEEANVPSVSSGISDSGISLRGIKDVLSGEGEEYQYLTAKRYVTALVDANQFPIGEFSFSFLDLLIVTMLIVISIGYFGWFGSSQNRMYVYATMIGIGSLPLLVFLLITYWFTFPSYDALELASMRRYLAPYLCAVIIASLCLLGDHLKANKKGNYFVALLSIVLAISMPITDLVIENKDKENNTIEKNTYGHSDIAAMLKSVAKRGDRVQFICNGSDGYSAYIFRNAVCPVVSENNWHNIVGTKEIYNEQKKLAEELDEAYNPEIVSYEELEKRMKELQYVVVFHADAGFMESYAELFGGVENIHDGSVYKVNNTEQKIVCELVGTTGIKGWR